MASSASGMNHHNGPPINIPPNVNPFVYLIKHGEETFVTPLSGLSAVILGILMVFHWLIVVFCLFILIISSTSRQSRWFIRRLYIKHGHEEKLYKNPLYFLNSGLLMNISQLGCSSVASAYMWIQIRCIQSAEYAIGAQIMPCLGMIYIFETLSYWSMTHCFLVTIYFSRGFNQDSNSSVSRWISSPLIINTFFFGFPILVVATAFGLMIWTSISYNRSAGQIWKLVECLYRGSLVWDKLHDQSQSVEEKYQMGAQMVEIMSNISAIFDELASLAEKFLKAFRISQAVMLALVCVSCMVFVRMFFLSIGRRSSRRHSSYLKRKIFRDTSTCESDDANAINISATLPKKQLFYLLLRAFGVFSSIATQIAVLFIGSWRARELLMHPYWRGVSTWLLVLSSVWSAAPIAWQCWKLYAEEPIPKTGTGTERIYLPPIGTQSNSCPTTNDKENGTIEIQIKLPQRP